MTGYTATFAITVVKKVGPTGWTMNVTFSKHIKKLEQWTGDIAFSDGKCFLIRNKDYNAELEAGHVLQGSMNMQKMVYNESPANATIMFTTNVIASISTSSSVSTNLAPTSVSTTLTSTSVSTRPVSKIQNLPLSPNSGKT